MNVIFVYGSTREGSAGKKVLDAMAAGVEAAGNKAIKYDLSTMPLEGCRGCGACRKLGVDCVREDGLKPYFADLWNADVMVYSAPIYMGQAAGHVISFMNRHYCLKDSKKQNRLPEGKRVFAVYTQGAPEDYPDYNEPQRWLIETFGRYGLKPAGRMAVGGDTDLSPEGETITEAFELGRRL